MKCTKCYEDTGYKIRRDNGGRCRACGQEFAFEPKNENPKITDEMFRRAIDALSDRGRVKFTPNHLRYELDRRFNRWSWRAIWVSAAGIGFAAGYFLLVINAAFLILPAVLIAVAVVLGAKFEHDHFAHLAPDIDVLRLVHRWERVHGNILSLYRWRPDEALSGRIDPELHDYGFDRALVTDHAEIAAMLVANHFHIDHECAVLSIDGYPHGLRDGLVEVLRKNPKLRVMALHDASSRGCSTPRRLREARWFPDAEIAVMDLGLRPTQAQKQRLPYVQDFDRSLDQGAESFLTRGDVKLLERGRMFELAAIPPVRLIEAIGRGFGVMAAVAQGTSSGAGSDGGFYYYGDYSDDDEGAFDGDDGFG